jgi:hypothetical protein
MTTATGDGDSFDERFPFSEERSQVLNLTFSAPC